jgi:hypothetical protein
MMLCYIFGAGNLISTQQHSKVTLMPHQPVPWLRNRDGSGRKGKEQQYSSKLYHSFIGTASHMYKKRVWHIDQMMTQDLIVNKL